MNKKISKSMKWAVGLMLVPMLMFLPSIINFFIPETYVDIYLQNDAGISISELQNSQPGIAKIILLGFQGMGFTIIGYHLFAWPLILIPYKKAEKWAWLTLGITQLWLWMVNTIIEAQHSDSTFLTAFSICAIICIILSLLFSYRTVFKSNR